MKGKFLSEDWYRVAPLKPRLRSHVELHRQIFRGETWYVVQDMHSGKYHRVTPAGNLLLSLMNGQRSIQKLWEIACERFPDTPPTQPDVIHLLSQLHGADLVAGDSLPDLPELGRRHFREARQAMIARLRNPLAMRFGLFDPDNFLTATMPLFRPIFTVWGFVIWLALVLSGVVLAGVHWDALTNDIVGRVLSADNVILLMLAFPLVKGIHELGHAYAAKRWGGEVHEIGFMLLVLIPVPYVDASSSASFPEKWRRAIVGGAGIMVELALAAIALIFWINAESGLASAFAFNVMLIGGVSTLLFNGNPLLRFDGYFVFSDLLEIPNLGNRANRYFWYLVQRYLLGLAHTESPVTGRGEPFWLFSYAVAAFIYRIFISIAISLFIASKLFFIGIILAAWSLSNAFVFPIFKGAKWLLSSRDLRGRRLRAYGVVGTFLGAVSWGVMIQPVPHATLAPAVMLVGEAQIVRAEVDGFIQSIGQSDGAVAKGAQVMTLDLPALDAEVDLAVLRRDELRLRLDAARGRDPLQVASLREQIAYLNEQITTLQRRQNNLGVKAAMAGRLSIPNQPTLTGEFIRKGSELGYILDPDRPMRFRVAVPEAQAELVRDATLGIELSLMRAPTQSVPAVLKAFTPDGKNTLPSLAFSTDAGGPYAVDPTDPLQERTLQPLFTFDVEVAAGALPTFAGERALVRFDHGASPIGTRVWRSVRQLFLRQFNV